MLDVLRDSQMEYKNPSKKYEKGFSIQFGETSNNFIINNHPPIHHHATHQEWFQNTFLHKSFKDMYILLGYTSSKKYTLLLYDVTLKCQISSTNP